jgi:hypothetical protein
VRSFVIWGVLLAATPAGAQRSCEAVLGEDWEVRPAGLAGAWSILPSARVTEGPEDWLQAPGSYERMVARFGPPAPAVTLGDGTRIPEHWLFAFRHDRVAKQVYLDGRLPPLAEELARLRHEPPPAPRVGWTTAYERTLGGMLLVEVRDAGDPEAEARLPMYLVQPPAGPGPSAFALLRATAAALNAPRRRVLVPKIGALQAHADDAADWVDVKPLMRCLPTLTEPRP